MNSFKKLFLPAHSSQEIRPWGLIKFQFHILGTD